MSATPETRAAFDPWFDHRSECFHCIRWHGTGRDQARPPKCEEGSRLYRDYVEAVTAQAAVDVRLSMARREEREAIVLWLRSQPEGMSVRRAAELIEAKEHRLRG